MSWFNDSKIDKEILSKEQDILTAVQPVIELLGQLLTGQATLAKAIIKLDQKVNIIMSTTNDATAKIAELGLSEASLETHVSTLATDQATALADLKQIIENLKAQGANQLDDTNAALFQSSLDRLSNVDKALQALSQAAKDADPGAPIVVTNPSTPAQPTA